MANPSVKRRDFLKLIGIGASSMGLGITEAKPMAKTRDGMLVEAPDEYGGFLVEKLNTKIFPYEYNTEIIEKFPTRHVSIML
jgi:anaerobic selenocysteine-containing dehydrogenase